MKKFIFDSIVNVNHYTIRANNIFDCVFKRLYQDLCNNINEFRFGKITLMKNVDIDNKIICAKGKDGYNIYHHLNYVDCSSEYNYSAINDKYVILYYISDVSYDLPDITRMYFWNERRILYFEEILKKIDLSLANIFYNIPEDIINKKITRIEII